MRVSWRSLIDIIQIGVLLVPSVVFLVRLHAYRNTLEVIGLLIGSIVWIWIILLILGLLQLIKLILSHKFREGM